MMPESLRIDITSLFTPEVMQRCLMPASNISLAWTDAQWWLQLRLRYLAHIWLIGSL